MTGQGKDGRPWSDDELDIIVADYFAMLDAEVVHRPYVKAAHRAALVQQIGRTHGSVEFKHQNISAVLQELGRPWIFGYKPAGNYQDAIIGAIDRYLSSKGITYQQSPPAGELRLEEPTGVFIAPPQLQPATSPRPRLIQLIRKFDPVERDFQNRALGKAGEQFVLEVERKRLVEVERPDLARKVRWVAAEDGDGAGYDVRSFEPSGRERLIEVKTTNGPARTPFFLTRNEREVATAHADSWRLYRLHLFSQSPRIFTIAPPLEANLHLRAEAWRASFASQPKDGEEVG